MTKYLVFEQHYVPWAVAASNIISLRYNLYHRPAQYNLEVYKLNIDNKKHLKYFIKLLEFFLVTNLIYINIDQ